jgi:hypothetical protein
MEENSVILFWPIANNTSPTIANAAYINANSDYKFRLSTNNAVTYSYIGNEL